MASIWEKAISILAGKLNSGRSYLITAVPTYICYLDVDICYDTTGGKFQSLAPNNSKM